MVNELMVFDDIPRYLLSSNAELKKRAVEMLRRELERRKARRPWGSIEPYIIALYHNVFVDRNAEIGWDLLKYLERILPENKNALPIEVQEVADIILYAVRAEIGEIDRNSALNYVRNYKTTPLISELVKRIAVIELSGEYDDYLGELLKKVGDNMEQKLWYLESPLEDPEYRDVVENFFIDLDVAQFSREPENMFSIHTYFIHRAKELQKEYEERRRIIEQIRAEIEELKQRYNENIAKLSKKIETSLRIVIAVGTIGAIIADVWAYNTSNVIALAGSLAGSSLGLFANLAMIIKRLRDIIDPYISKLANIIAQGIERCKKEGRNVINEIRFKERELRDLEARLRKLR